MLLYISAQYIFKNSILVNDYTKIDVQKCQRKPRLIYYYIQLKFTHET